MKKTLTTALAMLTAMTAFSIKPAEMLRHTVEGLPVIGTLAPDATKSFSRLPDEMKDSVREHVWDLGLNSAGLAIRFSSDATDIGVSWKAMNRFNMPHMTATGIRGVDLYVLDDSCRWTTLGAGVPSYTGSVSDKVIGPDMERHMRDYMLYLPLYDGVDSVYILTDSLAQVAGPLHPDMPRRGHPIVVYGTSITQGGCASRPGMAYPAILERLTGIETVNLGLSGNGRLDPELARLMARADASAYIVDALPNCKSSDLEERLAEFVGILRAAHPRTPVLLVESPMFPISRFSQEVYSTLTEKNRTFRRIYEENWASDPKVIYVPADVALDDNEVTVDNYHYTDYGFRRMAEKLAAILAQIL